MSFRTLTALALFFGFTCSATSAGWLGLPSGGLGLPDNDIALELRPGFWLVQPANLATAVNQIASQMLPNSPHMATTQVCNVSESFEDNLLTVHVTAFCTHMQKAAFDDADDDAGNTSIIPSLGAPLSLHTWAVEPLNLPNFLADMVNDSVDQSGPAQICALMQTNTSYGQQSVLGLRWHCTTRRVLPKVAGLAPPPPLPSGPLPPLTRTVAQNHPARP